METKQTANRHCKVNGGIVRGGFTDDVLNAYDETALARLTEALEDLSRVKFMTSQKHVDAIESRMKRDDIDVKKNTAVG